MLQRDHPAPVPGDVRRAEGGAQVWRQDAARLHQRSHPRLDGLQEAGHLTGERSGDVSQRRQPGPFHPVRRLRTLQIG